MMFVTINNIARIATGGRSFAMRIRPCATQSARPELVIAVLMANAEAMVIRISHEINFEYFFGGNICVNAIMTVTTDAQKNISSLTEGNSS